MALGYEEVRLIIQKSEREIDLAAQHSIEKRRRDREGEQSSHASLTSDVMRRRPRRSLVIAGRADADLDVLA